LPRRECTAKIEAMSDTSDSQSVPVSGRPSDSAPLDEDGNPAWERIDFTITCSRCGYNLRMLERPLCPECGLEFSWTDALRRAELESNFLFEHRWQDRLLQSWLKTLWRSLWPWSFWRNVSIHERAAPGPLSFWLLQSVLLFPVAIFLCANVGFYLCRSIVFSRPSGSWSANQDLYRYMTYLDASRQNALRSCLLLIPFFLSAVAVLCGLRQTLARCKVRGVHMFRVVAYSAGPTAMAWLALLLLRAGLIRFLLPIVPIVYWAVGLQRYVQIPRARIVAITTAVVASLFTMTLMVVIYVTQHHAW
jgi:hypothetical protein